MKGDTCLPGGRRLPRLAVLGGQGLGDNLIEMVLAENARRCGWKTTFYGSGLLSLASWFPGHCLEKTLPARAYNATLSRFERILSPLPPPSGLVHELQQRWMNYNDEMSPATTRVDNLATLSRRLFTTGDIGTGNGIVPPEELVPRRFLHRICLHPTSAELSKNWLPTRFFALGQRLEAQGFEVAIIMARDEYLEWKPLVNRRFPLHGFATVADCAAFVYESGYFIGNDSGGGHLASCLGVPTLSIHGRRGKAMAWRPGWGTVEVVTPTFNLVGSSLRQRAWKYLLSVGEVERRFFRLVRATKME
ncbi:MAG: hypothetical protein CSA32_01455 [Desulfobulbus propionicus]|nr:MAG: hypothetical protein CSA32_01455 [Desulfobulbus propionicus]